MSDNPDPAPPDSAIQAAVTAAVRAVTLTTLAPGPVVADGHELPADDPLLVALTLSGALEGTVTLAVGDEFEQRLEYAAKLADPTETLAPVAEAVVAALAPDGGVEATPLAEVDAGAWPGDAAAVSSVGLADEGETVLALAFALTVPSPPGAGDDAISAPGTSSLSTSSSPPSDPPEAARGPAGPVIRPAVFRSAEAARLGAVEVDVAGVLGETAIALHELLAWLPGVIVPLHRAVGMPVDLRIDEATVAHAEVVVVDERYALRVVDVVANARARLTRGQLRTEPSGKSGP